MTNAGEQCSPALPRPSDCPSTLCAQPFARDALPSALRPFGAHERSFQVDRLEPARPILDGSTIRLRRLLARADPWLPGIVRRKLDPSGPCTIFSPVGVDDCAVFRSIGAADDRGVFVNELCHGPSRIATRIGRGVAPERRLLCNCAAKPLIRRRFPGAGLGAERRTSGNWLRSRAANREPSVAQWDVVSGKWAQPLPPSHSHCSTDGSRRPSPLAERCKDDGAPAPRVRR